MPSFRNPRRVFLVSKPQSVVSKPEFKPIGSFDQVFIDNWFLKLKDYLFDLIKDIINVCGKSTAETRLAMQNIAAKRKASMEREKFSEIEGN